MKIIYARVDSNIIERLILYARIVEEQSIYNVEITCFPASLQPKGLFYHLPNIHILDDAIRAARCILYLMCAVYEYKLTGACDKLPTDLDHLRKQIPKIVARMDRSKTKSKIPSDYFMASKN